MQLHEKSNDCPEIHENVPIGTDLFRKSFFLGKVKSSHDFDFFQNSKKVKVMTLIFLEDFLAHLDAFFKFLLAI
jgi:hypothetical protein